MAFKDRTDQELIEYAWSEQPYPKTEEPPTCSYCGDELVDDSCPRCIKDDADTAAWRERENCNG